MAKGGENTSKEPGLLDVVSGHLECSICLGRFTSPRTLPCLHTFCHTCLKSHVSMESRDRIRVRNFKCPNCRKLYTPEDRRCVNIETWIKTFPINTLLEDVIKCVKKCAVKDANFAEYMKPISDSVENCENHPKSKIEFYCSFHTGIFCKICKETTHAECETNAIEEILMDEERVLVASVDISKKTIEIRAGIASLKETLIEEEVWLRNHRVRTVGFTDYCKQSFLNNTIGSGLIGIVNRIYKPEIGMFEEEIRECTTMEHSIDQGLDVLKEVMETDPRRALIEYCKIKKLVERVGKFKNRLRAQY